VTSRSRGSAGAGVGISHDLAFDLVLVDELEDVRCVDEDGGCASDGHGEEDTQLEPVNHHSDVPPVIEDLHQNSILRTHIQTEDIVF